MEQDHPEQPEEMEMDLARQGHLEEPETERDHRGRPEELGL